MAESEIYSWKDYQQNPYNVRISPYQLSSDGEIIQVKGLLKKESRSNPKRWLKLRFDKEFVIGIIIRRVIEPLRPLPYELIIQIFIEAIETHKKLTNSNGEN